MKSVAGKALYNRTKNVGQINPNFKAALIGESSKAFYLR